MATLSEMAIPDAVKRRAISIELPRAKPISALAEDTKPKRGFLESIFGGPVEAPKGDGSSVKAEDAKPRNPTPKFLDALFNSMGQ